MADEKTPENDGPETPEVDPVEQHPVAHRIRRAIQAHPILRDEKKLEVGVEDGNAHVSGSVFTINMYDQLVELVNRAAEGAFVVFTAEPQIKPPAGHKLVGRVPPVYQGPAGPRPDYSVDHLPRR